MNLYISDLDGTLLDNNAKLSPYTISSLNKLISKGLNFSAATARTPATVVPLLSKLNLHLPVIVMNGAAIYDLKKETYITYNPINEASVSQINKILEDNYASVFAYTISNNHINAYYNNLNNDVQKNFMNDRIGSPYKTFIKSKLPNNSNVLYFLLLEKKDLVMNIYDKIQNISGIYSVAYEDVYNKDFYNLEIYSDKSSKANAIKEIMAQYNFDRLISFGDNLNDLPMFKISDECYAVNNGNTQLKSISTNIINSNNNDGVVKYLEKLKSF